MDRELSKNYMSLIYADNERIADIQNEYDNLYFWNKKYIGKYLPKNKNAQILDIGCGMGQNLYTFSKLGYQNVVGVDFATDCVEFCKKNNFNAVEASAEEYLTDKKNFFDVITIYHVVEHIKKDYIITFLKILSESLVPGGIIIINIPNAANAISGVDGRYADFTHEVLYNERSMEQLLKLSGFTKKNIAVHGLVAYAPDDTRIGRKILKKAILPIMTFISDVIWYFFFISQGGGLKKNRHVLLAIARKPRNNS